MSLCVHTRTHTLPRHTADHRCTACTTHNVHPHTHPNHTPSVHSTHHCAHPLFLLATDRLEKSQQNDLQKSNNVNPATDRPARATDRPVEATDRPQQRKKRRKNLKRRRSVRPRRGDNLETRRRTDLNVKQERPEEQDATTKWSTRRGGQRCADCQHRGDTPKPDEERPSAVNGTSTPSRKRLWTTSSLTPALTSHARSGRARRRR